jgi:sugar phosphate isomerase/epimerase
LVAFSSDYLGESQDVRDIEATIRAIAEAGFPHIHWVHEWEGDYLYSPSEMLQIRDWHTKYGVAAKGVHATEGSARKNVIGKYHYRWEPQNRKDYTSFCEYNREAGVDLIKNRVNLATVLGTHEIVLHMQLPYRSFREVPGFKERYYGQVLKSFASLEGYCAAREVRICVENMMGTPNDEQIDQFERLFDAFGPEFVGMCFDNGHGHNTNMARPVELAERFQDRIFFVHLSDNVGLGSEAYWDDCPKMSACDEHKIPFEATFPWDQLVPILAAAPLTFPLTLEVAQRDPADTTFLRRAYEAGNRLEQLVLATQAA